MKVCSIRYILKRNTVNIVFKTLRWCRFNSIYECVLLVGLARVRRRFLSNFPDATSWAIGCKTWCCHRSSNTWHIILQKCLLICIQVTNVASRSEVCVRACMGGVAILWIWASHLLSAIGNTCHGVILATCRLSLLRLVHKGTGRRVFLRHSSLPFGVFVRHCWCSLSRVFYHDWGLQLISIARNVCHNWIGIQHPRCPKVCSIRYMLQPSCLSLAVKTFRLRLFKSIMFRFLARASQVVFQ